MDFENLVVFFSQRRKIVNLNQIKLQIKISPQPRARESEFEVGTTPGTMHKKKKIH